MSECAGAINLNEVGCYARKWLGAFQREAERGLTVADPDAVHDLRVASRRLSQLLDLVAVRPFAKRARQAQESLRAVRRAFRHVRDLDVLVESLAIAENRGMLDDEDRGALEQELTAQREAALAAAKRKCRKALVSKIVRRVERLCEAVSAMSDRRGEEVGDRLRGKLRRRADALLEQDPRACRAVDLHEARIREKRLRYGAEIWNEAGASTMDGLLENLAGMQTLLGQWNDHIEASKVISRIARRRRVLCERPRWSARLLEYAAFRIRAAMEDQERVCQAWPGLAAAVQSAMSDLDERQVTHVELV